MILRLNLEYATKNNLKYFVRDNESNQLLWWGGGYFFSTS